jgi:Rod binding domain-containing protein
MPAATAPLAQGIGRPGSAVAAGGPSAIDPRLRETAQEFEAVFLAQVLSTMKVGLGGAGPFGEGDNEAWAGMLQEEYGRLISRSGGIGVADALLREMLKLQES